MKKIKAQSLTVDYGAVNLKRLIVTTDKKLYELMKKEAQDNIGVLFEPKTLNDVDIEGNSELYIIGVEMDEQG